ncbi:MAG: SDR family oxidoreductase [Pseudomonadota bacterium]
MSTQTILVAGATGTNGRALIEQLLTRDGIKIRALVRDASSPTAEFDPSVEVVEGDLSNTKSLDRALQGVDRAFIVTAIVPNTVQLFQNFFNAARRAGTKHVVKFSGLGASTDSPSEVIRQHGASDDALRESGLRYTIVRPNSFHQNILWQAQAIAKGGTFYLPLKDARQSTIDVRDLAEIIANILTSEEHYGETYDLTGPEGLTYHEIAEILSEIRGSEVRYVAISREEAKAAMTEQGLPEWSAEALTEIQELFATGRYGAVTPDAKHLLGRPPSSFRTFAKDFTDVWQPGDSA